MMLTKLLSCLALLSGQSAYAFVPPSITSTTKTTTAGSALYSTTKSNDENGVDGRRAFLTTSTVGCLACLFGKPTLVHADGSASATATASTSVSEGQSCSSSSMDMVPPRQFQSFLAAHYHALSPPEHEELHVFAGIKEGASEGDTDPDPVEGLFKKNALKDQVLFVSGFSSQVSAFFGSMTVANYFTCFPIVY